jgi:hypothetical protein
MTSDATTRLAKWVLVVVGFASLAVLLGVVARSFVSWKALLLLLVVLVPVALLSYRLSRAERAYDRGRYGVGRRVVTDRITLDDAECGVCGDHGGNGVRRRFVKELVVDGVPVALVESGSNDYCRECFAAESGGDPGGGNSENDEMEGPTSRQRERSE